MAKAPGMNIIAKGLSLGFSATLLLSAVTIPRAAHAFEWSGLNWQLKDSNGAEVGPGPNEFDGENVIFNGANQPLTMTMRRAADGSWSTSEIISEETVGYGTYTMVLQTPISDFDDRAVLGFFTWSTRGRTNEMDVEIARFRGTDPDDPRLAHSVQPRSNHYPIPVTGRNAWGRSIHTIVWAPNGVTITSMPADDPSQAITSTFGRSPRPSSTTNLRINFWWRGGVASEGAASPQRAVIERVSYEPR